VTKDEAMKIVLDLAEGIVNGEIDTDQHPDSFDDVREAVRVLKDEQ
jgi:hypothetical protein